MMGAEAEAPLRPETTARAYKEGRSADGTVAYSKAVRLARKGEDFAVELIGSPVSAFAVFDGHSGRTFAQAASEMLCQRIMEAGRPFTEEKIADAFWGVDAEHGVRPGEKSGTTAQVMLVEKVEEETSRPKMRVTVAWCGDSSLVMTDMSKGVVEFATASHSAGPDHQGEERAIEVKQLMMELVLVRKIVEEQRQIDSLKTMITESDIRAALASLGSEAPIWGDHYRKRKHTLDHTCPRMPPELPAIVHTTASAIAQPQ